MESWLTDLQSEEREREREREGERERESLRGKTNFYCFFKRWCKMGHKIEPQEENRILVIVGRIKV